MAGHAKFKNIVQALPIGQSARQRSVVGGVGFKSAIRIDVRLTLGISARILWHWRDPNHPGTTIGKCLPNRTQDGRLCAAATDPAVNDAFCGDDCLVTGPRRGGCLNPQNAHECEGLILLLEAVCSFEYLE
jgi:hypothetical protein